MLAVNWLPGDTVAENLVALAAVLGALGVIWQKAIRPTRNGIRKVLDTIDRVEAAVKKTEQQTNGALDQRFADVNARLDRIEALVSSVDGALAIHIEKFHPPKET